MDENPRKCRFAHRVQIRDNVVRRVRVTEQGEQQTHGVLRDEHDEGFRASCEQRGEPEDPTVDGTCEKFDVPCNHRHAVVVVVFVC